jgi:hypothetical protein
MLTTLRIQVITVDAGELPEGDDRMADTGARAWNRGSFG